MSSNKKAAAAVPMTQVQQSLVPATESWETRTSRAVLERGVMATSVVGSILAPMAQVTGPDGERRNLSRQVAQDLMDQLMDDIQPRSALERMLVEQLVITHAQAMRVQHMVAKEERYGHIERMAAVVSKILADFRKTALTLKELRAPAKSFIVAQQANIAQQQVVNQNIPSTNEQGANDA
jgi:RNA 3'-terminal phosphate cyclase